MNELALFAGAGGGILGGHFLGWRCVCAVEFDHYARSVLMARQNDGCLPPFPIWDDVRTFDGRLWRGRVDVVSGGFPCQDISCAGKGAGITGERSGLWGEMARIIGEVRPRFVWVENSPMLVRRGLAVVLGDLAEMGFDARWGVVGAHDVGAPHKRDRIWIVATDANSDGEHAVSVDAKVAGASKFMAHAEGVCGGTGLRRRGAREVDQLADCRGDIPDADEQRTQIQGAGGQSAEQVPERFSWWGAEPDVGRVAHGVAARVDRLRCIGNGQVPRVVQQAWKELIK